MNKNVPCFNAIITNYVRTCGEAMINGQRSYIIRDEREGAWYEAAHHGSLYDTKNYTKIQIVHWDPDAEGFIS